MTFHSGANQTSFITAAGSGDHTADLDVFSYEFTTASWFFIDAADVMAPADTIVVCAFGDSIRMFGRRGNPQAKNLFSVIGYLQKQAGLQLHVTVGPV
jgi:hypothetical protein